MISARVLLKGSDRELGWWQFSDLPRAGELVTLRVDDQPSSFDVADVIHVPIVKADFGKERPDFPYTVVVVEGPKPISGAVETV